MAQGDWNQNWEKNLIPANPAMQRDFIKVGKMISYWFRQYVNGNIEKKYILPQCVETICAEYCIVAKCGNCGQPGTDCSDKELYLNLYDGFIGCSRYFNRCSLKHWQENSKIVDNRPDDATKWNSYTFEVGDINNLSMAITLSSICETGGNVWCYSRDRYVCTRNNLHRQPILPVNKLEKLLKHFGIKMTEYKWQIS